MKTTSKKQHRASKKSITKQSVDQFEPSQDQLSNLFNRSIETNMMPLNNQVPLKITRPGSDPIFATKVFLKSKSLINTNYSREQILREKEKKLQ